MSIICLEGASGIGKSTTSLFLEENFNFKVIPEVNELFQRPVKESATWYFEKQVERWRLAENASINDGNVVLDGDPMQPLWYNWIFHDLGFQPLQEVFEFYDYAIQSKKIKFPEKYFILTASEIVLRKRKEGDKNRTRRNFETHLKLISPQLDYFSVMRSLNLGNVDIIQSKSVSSTAASIANSLPDLKQNVDQTTLLNNQREFVQEYNKQINQD
ncbi:chloramphenicol acetyltransferase [Colwelliaceae bacterium 6441]